MSNNPACPNVVFIDCHDLGDWIGCYDRPYVSSPNIDRLAARGTLFTNHFATAADCIRLLYPFTLAGAVPLQYRITDSTEHDPQTPRKELDT